MISSSDNTLIASKCENNDFLSYEKYHGYSLEGGTLPLTLLAFANFTIFVFASAFAIFFLSCVLMCTHCALSVYVLMLIVMLSVNVGENPSGPNLPTLSFRHQEPNQVREPGIEWVILSDFSF